MRKPLVAANWKMHGSRDFLELYLYSLQQKVPDEVEVVVFPPSVYLARAVECVATSSIAIGAQDLSAQPEGAFTGDISAAMLADVGCSHVLVGHSERRAGHGETSAQVADKFVAALAAGLTPVLCVGESLAEREQGATLAVVGEQLRAVVDAAGLARVAGAIIAYEPVWAIGTGRTASPEQAQEVHRELRAMLGDSGAQTRILYGGSVNADNADALFAQPDIDGGLVGGASLNPDKFAAICGKAK